ncbi:50S ribosomal protein L4 [Luoshenia tenuis]|jgi:large subunit ribosomal protein L4|uniref:50S ribosomal protein L4 n=1 Tax=Luoshenia tenuis TaxID=2763654 RepID=UPI003D89CD6C
MPTVSVYNMQGQSVGTIELSDAVFGVEVNAHAVHEVVVAQLANRRQGTQSALTRTEVSGGGKKPWRQKGTGRARQGSTRSPQWRHGGVVFAPKPRDYRITVNKKVRRLAMKSALTDKVLNSSFIVVDTLEMAAPKTREMAAILKNLGADKKTLVVTETVNSDVVRASGNIPTVKTTEVGTLNVYDIVNADKAIVTRQAVAQIEEVYA